MAEASDVLIIGAGPAGLTAAIYVCRAGWTATVLDRGFYGGQVAITPEVENYPGVLRIAGPDLSQNMYEQAVELGAQIRFEEVRELMLEGKQKVAVTSAGRYESRAVIIANGAKRRHLGCPGEEEFVGRGVSYCATCDGAFFRGKNVVLVGGGNTALEDALYLAKICSGVTIVHRRESFRGEKRLAKAAQNHPNIRILYNATVTEIQGDKSVTAVLVRDEKTGEITPVETSAVFVAIGYEPENGMVAPPVRLDKAGYILAGEDCLTGVQGVFAAGDCRTKPLRQIVTATADGAVAAFQAGAYLSSDEEKEEQNAVLVLPSANI